MYIANSLKLHDGSNDSDQMPSALILQLPCQRPLRLSIFNRTKPLVQSADLVMKRIASPHSHPHSCSDPRPFLLIYPTSSPLPSGSLRHALSHVIPSTHPHHETPSQPIHLPLHPPLPFPPHHVPPPTAPPTKPPHHHNLISHQSRQPRLPGLVRRPRSTSLQRPILDLPHLLSRLQRTNLLRRLQLPRSPHLDQTPHHPKHHEYPLVDEPCRLGPVRGPEAPLFHQRSSSSSSSSRI